MLPVPSAGFSAADIRQIYEPEGARPNYVKSIRAYSLAQVTCWPLAGAGDPDADLPPEVMGFLQWGQRTVPRTCEGRRKR